MIPLLFTLIVIHFSITLVILVRYASLKKEMSTGSVKREIYSVMREFNAQAERNIQILEDRIQKFQELQDSVESNNSEKKTRIPKRLSSSIESHMGNSLLSILKKEEKRKNPARNLVERFKENSKENGWETGHTSSRSKRTLQVPSLKDSNFLTSKESPYYIQEMYKHSQPHPSTVANVAKNTEKNIQKNTRKMKRSSDLKTPNFLNQSSQNNYKDSEKSSKNEAYAFEDFSAKELPSKTRNQIARLIGEGKSYEEMAEILGLSLSEIRLFVSILRKKILGSSSVS